MTTERPSRNLLTVAYRDRLAIITIDNPPVNAMSHAVRVLLLETLRTVCNDSTVDGIVLACGGRTFVAGADISEFGKPALSPTLRNIIATLDGIMKPTIAAVHGTALGGGLELSLACHYRAGLRSAKFGLPEVKLGLIPGAGGTVRLPYLIGAERALELIISGAQISADAAFETGLLDAVFDGDLVGNAVGFLKTRIDSKSEVMPVSSRRARIENTDLSALDALIAAWAKKARGLDAPIYAAEAVRNAIMLPFDEAQAKERIIFERLIAG